MENKDAVIRDLLARLDQLTRQQRFFQQEIDKIRRDIHNLTERATSPEGPVHTTTERSDPKIETSESHSTSKQSSRTEPERHEDARTRWEEFIGANLLNKVGIAVLVLGIGFGAKYSIDRGLIDAVTRIILGYTSGLILLAIAYTLRVKHKAFSGVLLSGAMSVFYFITYIGYSFYDGMIPQAAAFILMVIFTGFTVVAALRYNYEVIGIIGLVGAYAVPFLLGNNSGNVVILFSYMTTINTGILVLSFIKYWKRLYYSAFGLTWLSFASWYAFSFNHDKHAFIALVFSTIFYLIFYATFLAYKLLRRESLVKWEIICMLLNSFLYYGYGYLTIDSIRHGDQFLGLFTVFTASVHFIACVLVYRTHARFSDIFYFVAGMVLVFLTIAVPVQFEGNWVTLLWTAEAALLFWIGRAKSFFVYEKLSYPLMVLAFLSLLHDWSTAYPPLYSYSHEEAGNFRSFLNIRFLTSLLAGLSFVFILWCRQTYEKAEFGKDSAWNVFSAIGLPSLTVFILYIGAFKEIEAFWNNAYIASRVVVRGDEKMEYNRYNENLLDFRNTWLIMYSAAFATGLSLLQWKWRGRMSVIASLAVNVFVLLAFITSGLVDIASLRSGFLDQSAANNYAKGYGYILIRYAAILIIIPLLLINNRLLRLERFGRQVHNAENLFFHLVVLVLLSSELIHWLDMAGVKNSFRLSLSILWGAYAFLLIVMGLSKDAKHVRVGAIVLFAITLLKLFAYDMENMSTILKTIVMIALGALMLMASFVYNKYKRSAENEVP